MINPITETINSKEAVLFIYGNLSEVTRQFAEMLKYCKSDIFKFNENVYITNHLNI